MAFCTMLIVALFYATSRAADDPDTELTAEDEAEIEALALPVPQPWLGDFDGMRERRTVRILVPYSRTLYFVDRGRQMGIEYDLGMALEKALNAKYKVKNFNFHVVFIPVARDELLSGLINGLGDIAAGALTITEERGKLVDFTDPLATGVREIVVLGRDAPSADTVDDLSGREILVRQSSSYFGHLLELNKTLMEEGKPGMTLIPADEDLEDEDLLEMASAGLLDQVVVDRYKGQIWSRVFKDLTVREDLAISQGGSIAWAIRKNSPLLLAELNAFVKTHKIGTSFGNQLANRYLKGSKFVKNATAEAEMRRFNEVVHLFEKFGDQYSFDPLMIMAQGFQESALNQKARSPRGAVGIMQLLPATAADPAVGIRGIDTDAAKNIEAGAKYLRLLIDKYLNEPAIDEKNRVLMAFAAYNAGPGNLRKMRRLAEKSGLKTNVWFQNVEIGAARLVGHETVQYVSNIYKYYTAYKLVKARAAARTKSLPAGSGNP
jgi:membrane-bound lytic murein transglycosylase MltF